MARILVIQIDRLGDAIQTTPMLQEIGQAYPETKIDLLVNQEAIPLLRHMPDLDNIYSIAGTDVGTWSENIRTQVQNNCIPDEVLQRLADFDFPFYDRVINVSHSTYAAWLTQRIPAAERQGGLLNARGEWFFSGAWHNYLMALVSFRDANAFNLVDLFRGAAAVESSRAEALYVDVDNSFSCELLHKPYVVINPGASKKNRCWPSEHFATLAERVAAHGFFPVLMGSPADKEICAEVESHAQIELLNLCGQTSLPEAAALLAGAEALVSNDTGAVHIAAAVRTPIVGIYGFSAFFRETGPWGAGHIILQVAADKNEESLKNLSVELVFNALLFRLGRVGIELLQEGSREDVSIWQSFFLDSDVDPLGGMAYWPLHRKALSFDEMLAYSLRHVLAMRLANSSRLDCTYLQEKYRSGELQAPDNYQAQVDGFKTESQSLQQELNALRTMIRDLVDGIRGEKSYSQLELAEQGKGIDAGFDDIEEKEFEFSALRLIVSHLCWRRKMLVALPLQKILSYYDEYLEDSQFILETLLVHVTDLVRPPGQE
ncbi:MAG: hypothetical protein CMH60_06165 [Myxococcales bacterium]|nr:hypothetical protein [Myxococcales bacterium]